MARILLVEDETSLAHILSVLLRAQGHDVVSCGTGRGGIEEYRKGSVDVVLLDYALPDLTGAEVFRQLRDIDSRVVCIYMTAFGSIRSAVDAIRGGALDYLPKPFDNDELLVAITRAVEVRRLTREVEELRGELETRYGFDELISVSGGMREVLRRMAKIASVDATVLILGESGTGKELVARAIHRQSPRGKAPFVAVNCGAVPAHLVEAEFFGHERGAFTDAKETHQGKFEQAQGGVLFLDEIGELPVAAQAKLLRALQEREITRIGGRRVIRVDVRVVAATNIDLEAAVKRGAFREDLYWRLNVLPVRVPPLRDRREDIPLMVDTLLRRINVELTGKIRGISEAAMHLIMSYDWPGNVRELENALRRAAVFCESVQIEAEDLPLSLRQVDIGTAQPSMDSQTLADVVQEFTARVERDVIRSRLAARGGNRSATAESLGINRKTLFRKMRELGIAEADEDEE
jgi:DNA-binding NtrC family response regulator